MRSEHLGMDGHGAFLEKKRVLHVGFWSLKQKMKMDEG